MRIAKLLHDQINVVANRIRNPVTGLFGGLNDGRLERLSEILGAVHYLRNLCLKEGEDTWRKAMESLIGMEAGNEQVRKERLTAAFNRGYRSFASVYTACTAQAVVAEEKYRNEGATLATEITARFGN